MNAVTVALLNELPGDHLASTMRAGLNSVSVASFLFPGRLSWILSRRATCSLKSFCFVLFLSFLIWRRRWSGEKFRRERVRQKKKQGPENTIRSKSGKAKEKRRRNGRKKKAGLQIGVGRGRGRRGGRPWKKKKRRLQFVPGQILASFLSGIS